MHSHVETLGKYLLFIKYLTSSNSFREAFNHPISPFSFTSKWFFCYICMFICLWTKKIELYFSN